jgi:hypothetical protein
MMDSYRSKSSTNNGGALVVIAMVGVNLEDLEVQRSSCRESTWRSVGNSSCHLNKMMLW